MGVQSCSLLLVLFIKSPLKMMKNALKALFVLRYLYVCPYFFVHVVKRLGKRAKVNIKIYGVIYWEANNFNAPIAQYFNK